MYSLTTKNGNIVFLKVEVLIYVVSKRKKLFVDRVVIKITELEDIEL